MYSFQGFSEEVKAIVQSVAVHSDMLFHALKPGRVIKIPSNRRLYVDAGSRDCIYRIIDGHIKYFRGGSGLIVCPEGCLIGIEDVVTQSFGRYENDFAVELMEYRLVDVLSQVMQSTEIAGHWSYLLASRSAVFSQLMHENLPAAEELNAECSSYEADETIIAEGVVTGRVFTLISGIADVYVKGVKVGVIEEDETFGAISALTGAVPNATIKARTHCMVMHTEGQKFVNLIKGRPASTMKLVRDMARIIASSNKVISGG